MSNMEDIVSKAARSLMDAYRQGVLDGKTEGFDEGYQAGFKAGRNMTDLIQTQKDGEPISLLADLVRKATGFGVQDEHFIASYLLPTGPIHRAYAYLQGLGIDLTPAAIGVCSYCRGTKRIVDESDGDIVGCGYCDETGLVGQQSMEDVE